MASGAACHQGVYLRGELRVKHAAAYALRAEQALVAREADGGCSALLHADRHDACRLGGVYHERDSVAAADGAHLAHGQDGAADVTCVRHDHGTRLGADEPLDLGRIKRSVGSALGTAERHTRGRQLRERAHDGVVLHTAHDDVVAGVQKALEHEVQGLGDVASEDHV